MRRIDDPYALKEVLARLSEGPLTPAQARLLLAGRGIRARQKVEEAVTDGGNNDAPELLRG